MWRAFFLAIGAFISVLGLEALAIDRAIVKPEVVERKIISQPEIVPPAWAAWSMLGAGAVVTLYSFTIPKRVKSD